MLDILIELFNRVVFKTLLQKLYNFLCLIKNVKGSNLSDFYLPLI